MKSKREMEGVGGVEWRDGKCRGKGKRESVRIKYVLLCSLQIARLHIVILALVGFCACVLVVRVLVCFYGGVG
jgi:hypothetical protein